jgi:hypothetical protein
MKMRKFVVALDLTIQSLVLLFIINWFLSIKSFETVNFLSNIIGIYLFAIAIGVCNFSSQILHFSFSYIKKLPIKNLRFVLLSLTALNIAALANLDKIFVDNQILFYKMTIFLIFVHIIILFMNYFVYLIDLLFSNN